MQKDPEEKEKLERLRRDINAAWVQLDAGDKVEFDVQAFLATRKPVPRRD